MKVLKKAVFKKILVLSSLASSALLLSCSTDVGSPDGFVEDACLFNTRTYIAPPPLPADDVREDTPVTNATELWDAISFLNGTRINNTNMPLLSTDADLFAGTFDTVPQFQVWDDSTTPIVMTGINAPAGLRPVAAFIQASGELDYYIVPISSSTSSSVTMWGPWLTEAAAPGTRRIDETWAPPPPNVGTLVPVVVRIFMATDSETPDFSNPLTVTGINDPNRWLVTQRELDNFNDGSVTPLALAPQALGTGLIQISLIWDQPNDIDLHVYESGYNDAHIWYNAKNGDPLTTGFLDADDIDGYGAENIVYATEAGNADYRIDVNYYNGSTNTDTPSLFTRYYVFVKACGEERLFSGTLQTMGNTDTVFTLGYNSAGCTLFPPPQLESPSFFEEAAICDHEYYADEIDANQ